MKKNLLEKISVKSVATFISIALLITGICCVGTEGNVVQAAAPEAAVSVNGEGYYVKDFTGAQFNAYKEEGTYPKMVTKKDDDVQEWLFAGWYQKKDDAKGTCTNAYDSATTTVATSATVYAKFVPASVMAVKCQVTPETDVDSEKANMRLISTTDSADYTKMGFNVVYKGKTIDCYTTTLYKRVAASDDGMECNYSANAFDNASNYFFAVRLTNIGNANFSEPFYIEPYWVTADGTTVTGVSRYARVEDSYEKIVNLPVRLYSDEEVTKGEVSFSYDATRFELYAVDGETKVEGTVFDTVTVDISTAGTIKLTGNNTAIDEVVPTVLADGIFANIRLQLKEGQLIESNTSFAVTNERFSNSESSVTLDVANILYKNYAMDYAGTPDTSWYDDFEDNDTFVISTAADLYGLAAIVNDTTGDYAGEQFAGDEIILGADIVINKGQASAEQGWNADGQEYEWIPIGTGTTDGSPSFKGVFNGQMNEIEGLVIKDATYYYKGLFGWADKASTIKNISITNSYFKHSSGVVGSIAGRGDGNLDTVYSDAILETSTNLCGGIVGWRQNNNSVEYKNCWYAGTILAKEKSSVAGGIVGRVRNGELTINNCLFSGEVHVSGTDNRNVYIGGLLGQHHTPTNASYTVDISIQNSMNTGTFSYAEGITSVNALGRIIGGISESEANTLSIDNVYYTIVGEKPEYTWYPASANIKELVGEPVKVSEADVTGNCSYFNQILVTDTEGAWTIAQGTPELTAFAENAWNAPDITGSIEWYTGLGDKSFTINNSDDLYGFASMVNAGMTFNEKTINIGEEDIIINEDAPDTSEGWETYLADNADVKKWTPIGTADYEFAGNFNGNEKSIKGLYVDTDQVGAGLFRGTAEGSTIQNLKLENSYVNSTCSESFAVAGSIVAACSGNLSNVYSNAVVKASQQLVGGIVGQMYSESAEAVSVDTCWFAGSLNAAGNCGGIIGVISQGNITMNNCLNTGAITGGNQYIGGLCGRTSRSTIKYQLNGTAVDCLGLQISNSLNAGPIVSLRTKDTTYYAGSVIGRIQHITDAEMSVTNVYATNESYTMDESAKWCGNGNTTDSSTVITLAKQAITGKCAYFNKILVTDAEGIWTITQGTPELAVFSKNALGKPDITGSIEWYTGLGDKSFTINNSDDLYGFAYMVNAGMTFDGKIINIGEEDIVINENVPSTSEDWETYLADNADVKEWTPIGTADYEFAGTFNGNEKSIIGLYVDTDQEGAGLFRGTAEGSAIQNLKLVNSYVNSTCSESFAVVGSIVAACSGNLSNVYSNAVVKASQQLVGGIVGQMYSESAEAVSVDTCWFAGSLNAAGNCGGIIGVISQGNITMNNCLNTGAITGGNQYIGGLCGRTSRSTIKYQLNGTAVDCLGLQISNSLNAGPIVSLRTKDTTYYAGSVIGRIQHITDAEMSVTNVYATNESYTMDESAKWCGNGNTTDSSAVITLAKQDIKGPDVSDEIFAPLGTDAWVPTLEMPVPAVFVDYAATIDVAWYEEGGDRVIDTRAELLGLSYLSQTQSIEGTITLGADIDLNPGWTASENSYTPTITWSSIGTKTYPFAGTFEGNGHTISGVYLNATDGQYKGLFGYTAAGSEITDFRLENSYLYNSLNYTGSIVGCLQGNLSKVYSNAIVTSGASRLGGLVAYADPISATDQQIQITDCWFDGKIIGSSGGQYLGGVVSTIRGGTCNMENILFTGQIESDYNASGYAYIGGIVADVGYSDNSNNTILNLESVVSAGSIISHWKPNYVHAVVGNARKYGDNTEPQLVMSNVFATRDCYETPYGGNAEKSGTVVRTTGVDRLIGTSSYEDKNPDKTKCHLDFSEWSMRMDDVPIPTCFSNLSKVKDTVVTGFEPESLAKEIGLVYWNSDAKITDTTFYGAGNYLVSYDAEESKYKDYIAILTAEEGTETEKGYTGLGFSEYITNDETGMATDGVYASTYCKEATAESGEWVLNITYVENKSKIYISVNTDVESIAPTLKADNKLANPTEAGDEDISLSMLEIMPNENDESNGNSFVFQLPNKHFIVIDGGREADGANLVEYLRGQVGEGQDVVIDAWFITHYHADHSGALKAFYKDSSLRENVYLEAIYACEPSSYALDYKESDQQLTDTNEALRGAKTLTKKSDGTKPDVYQLHMGQRYYFYGMTMDVIDTQEQRHVSTWGTQAPDDFNASSTNCVFTFKDKNSDIKKVLIGGDATNMNMQYIMQAYGEENQTLSDIDVFVAYHHGLNTTIDYIGYPNLGTANYTWSNFLLENNDDQFEVVFFPYYKIYRNDDKLPSSVYPSNIGNINQYLYEHANAYYTYGYDDCLGEYDKDNRHGTVKVIFDGNNTAIEYLSGEFTTPAK